MKTSMVSREASTFVSLAQAVQLARTEGVLDAETSSDLSAALVAGMLTGCMEMETYGRVHDALARLLEKAFEAPAREAKPAEAGESGGAEGPLGVYLEVVGEAWDKVSWEEEASARLKRFVQKSFDLRKATFGAAGWFSAPLRADADAVLRDARAAGLLVVSMQGAPPAGAARALLCDPESEPGAFRLVLGWGERRVALDLLPAQTS